MQLSVQTELGLLDVEATYFPPSRGMRDSLGVPEEPDDEGGWEIESVKLDGQEMELSDEDLEAIYQALEEMRTEPNYD